MGKKVYKAIENYRLSIFFAIIFGFYMYKTSVSGDDSAFIAVGMNTKNIVNFLVRRYNIWSSRVFIEAVTIIVSQTKLSFSLFSGFSMLVLLYSIINLTVEDDKAESSKLRFIQLLVVFIIMLYPFKELSNAGWRATLNNYFFPICYGFFSILILKKLVLNRPVCLGKYLIGCISLLFACSQELELILLTVVYLVMGGYVLISKEHSVKYKIFSAVNLFIVVISYLFIYLCPGVKNRNVAESERILNFRGYSILDKLDAGYSLTIYEIIFGNKVYIFIICCLITFCVYKRYKNIIYRGISTLSLIILSVWGPLKTISYNYFPEISRIEQALSIEGLVNVENIFSPPIMQYIVFSLFVISFCSGILLLANDYLSFGLILTLIIGGFLSRIAMGFSPTIYASGSRTYSIMGFAFIAAIAIAIGRNYFYFNPQNRKVWIGSLCALGLLSFLNLGYQIFLS